MISNTGLKILTNARVNNYFDSVKKSLKYFSVARIILTLFLLIWVIIISFLLIRENKKDVDGGFGGFGGGDSDSGDSDDKRLRYFNLHRVWFGEESVILILFKMWYYAIIIWMISPMITPIILYLKTKIN